MPGRGQVSLSESDSLLLSFALFSSIRRLNENQTTYPKLLCLIFSSWGYPAGLEEFAHVGIICKCST